VVKGGLSVSTKEEAKARLAKAHRILYMEGLAEDTYRGHITLKTETGIIYIKPWAMGFQEVRETDLLGVDLDGNLVDGKGRLHSELPIHLEIYRSRSEIVSVVHLHPYYSVLLSSVFDGKMKMITQNGMHFWEGVPFHTSPELINSKKQGEELSQLMGERLVLLMRNHGIVTAGRSLEEAMVLAIDFEKAAKEHLMISTFGTPTEISLETAQKMSSRIFSAEQYRMMWDFYCRKLARGKFIEKQGGTSL
jgi:L-fuculose-phosphate aldolase